jgi:hypothetical protein
MGYSMQLTARSIPRSAQYASTRKRQHGIRSSDTGVASLLRRQSSRLVYVDAWLTHAEVEESEEHALHPPFGRTVLQMTLSVVDSVDECFRLDAGHVLPMARI